MPKQRTRGSGKEALKERGRRRGLDGRARDVDARIRERSGDTRIDTLRQTYGDSFAPGIRGDAHLKTLLGRTGSNSLSDYLKTVDEDNANQKSTNVRYAAAERFNEAHRKTSLLHAGLFRRLAE